MNGFWKLNSWRKPLRHIEERLVHPCRNIDILHYAYISLATTVPYSLDCELTIFTDPCHVFEESGSGGSRVNLANDQNRYGTFEASVIGSSFSRCEVPRLPEVATLVFDSAQAPAAAGIRGAFTSARQLLYRSGSVCIDMRMQPKPGTDSMVLVGQLLDSASPTHGMSDVSVRLVCEGDTVACKKTNDFGEFDFGFETLHHSQLIIGIGKRKTIVVPVPDAVIEGPYPVE